jgi:hypothetical protein
VLYIAAVGASLVLRVWGSPETVSNSFTGFGTIYKLIIYVGGKGKF